MSDLDDKIRDAQRRANLANMRGASGPYPEEWANLVEAATSIVKEKMPTFFEDRGMAPPRGLKLSPRMMPPDYVAVRAESILGLERRLADLEAQYLAAMRSWQSCRDEIMLMRGEHHPLEDAILNALEYCCELSDDPIINYSAKVNIKAKIEDYYGRSIQRAPRMT